MVSNLGSIIIVAVAKIIKQQIEKSLAGQSPKIEVIYPSIDVSSFISLAPPVRASDGIPCIGIIANHYRVKKIEDALYAFKLLLKKRPLRLLLVGTPRETTINLANTLGVADWCEFTGWQYDVRPLLAKMELVLLCSQLEGVPAVLIEAMAAGRPIVATCVGGVPEIITHNLEGVLIQPGKPTSIVAEVERILDNPIIMLKFGQAGRERVKLFSHENRVAEVWKLYNDLANNK